MDSRAYILHLTPWRDTSVLMDVLCRERGRLRVAARGIKGKKRSPMVGVLQAFVPLHIQLNQRRDYFYLTDADALAPAWPLPGDAALCALYCNELLLRLLPDHDGHDSLFDCYERSLQALSTAAADETQTASVLRRFEWTLLSELGYGIALDCDEAGNALLPERYYQVHPEHGILPADATQTGFLGSDLLAFANHNWVHQPSEAKRLLRLLLAAHLGTKPLQTRALWRARRVLKQLADEPVAAADTAPLVGNPLE
ncbi:MAG: DNA repair protein RecO [Permianibacter sp.]